MRQWKLGLNDPQNLGLAADARLSKLDYENDQIWELILGRGDPAAIILQSTYGLRARNMRIFPEFSEKQNTISDPNLFHTPPTITRFFPNYLMLKCSPFMGIEVEMEYWVPDSQTVAGRIRVINSGVIDRNIKFDLIGLLNPTGDEAQIMAPATIEAVNVLQGKTSDLSPLLFITGGANAVSSPYPALSHEMNLLPGSFRQFTWVHVGMPDHLASFKRARQVATRKWGSEIAQIEMANSDQLEIHTGNPDWDATFALGQKTAHGLLFDGGQHLAETSFVNTRLPDQGYSDLGDGSDYGPLWNGQTALDAWYLAQNLLPGSPEILEGLLINFFNSQEPDGKIDFKPGLAGQRSHMQSFPILADLTWRIYQSNLNTEFLKFAFPFLKKYLETWFDSKHDRDGDGIPEWDNSIQSGYDDNPIFAKYHQWSQGVEISTVESPDLSAYLYRECKTLIKIAMKIKSDEELSDLENYSELLKTAVENSWDPRATTYRYWDRDTHQSPRGKKLSQRKGPGKIPVDLKFEEPVRLQIRFEVGAEIALKTKISIHGKSAGGQKKLEKVDPTKITWMPGFGMITLERPYTELDHVEISDFPDKGKVSIHTIDLKKQDQTLLTPIWAEIPNPERVKKILKNKLSKGKPLYKKFGLPASTTPLKREDAESIKSVWLPWNVMLGEGLLAYDHKEEAVDLFQRIMDGIVGTLKREHAFRKLHHTETGKGLGERNALAGLPPAGLFLDILGVRIHSPWHISINGFNPFPNPVSLKFKGLRIECLADKIRFTFPDGQQIIIDDPSPCQIKLQQP